MVTWGLEANPTSEELKTKGGWDQLAWLAKTSPNDCVSLFFFYQTALFYAQKPLSKRALEKKHTIISEKFLW